MIVLWFSALLAVSYGCNSRDYGQGSTVCVCTKNDCDSIGQVERLAQGKYVSYTTSMDGLRFNKTEGVFDPETEHNHTNPTIYIDRNTKFQHMFGFGGAFTDSAGINILSLTKETAHTLLKAYFGADGVQYSMGRIPIGGTDFSTRAYTYDDVKDDVDLKFFSLQNEDKDYKIPIIKEALNLTDGDMKLFGTAWTAPFWMKTNNRDSGIGFLKEQYYALWAHYHKKFLDGYLTYNITIWGLTTGNEPANGFNTFIKINDMGWIPNHQADWIGSYLGPVIKGDKKYENIKIMIIDDQRVYFPWIPAYILQNKKAYKYIDGIGVHYYTDRFVPAKVLSETHIMFPEKFILATEACEGSSEAEAVILGSWERAENYLTSIIEDINNWATGFMDWNLALNAEGGPTYAKNYVDSPIIVNATSDEFYKQPMFYAMGHFSKFVRPDSVRIHSNCSVPNLMTVAFTRPDGGIILQVFNPTDIDISLTVHDEHENVDIHKTIIKRSVTSILYW